MASSPNPDTQGDPNDVALCASCDRCRARKTKCDGSRPCGNCVAKYLKKNKLSGIEDADVDVERFECIYSPAKRRGPVPGRAGQTRKASEALDSPGSSGGGNNSVHNTMGALGHGGMGSMGNIMGLMGGMNGGLGMASSQATIGSGGDSSLTAEMLQQHYENQHQSAQAQLAAFGITSAADGASAIAMDGQQGMAGVQANLEETMALQRQMLLLQQQQMALQNFSAGMDTSSGFAGGSMDKTGPGGGAGSVLNAQHILTQQQLAYLQQLQVQQQQKQAAEHMMQHMQQPPSQRIRTDILSSASPRTNELSKYVVKHLPLLKNSSSDGNRLRSYYALSVDELFCLPAVPTDEEYCARLNGLIKPDMLPSYDIAALQAARFAEIAIGALANDQVDLALELNNATVMCIRECVEEPVHSSCMFDISRAYFLHGIFRSFRGDMVRYFKYRRVCLTHISQLDHIPVVENLLAAISVHDAWAYMIYNANEQDLPDIDDSIPQLPPNQNKKNGESLLQKYGISSNPSHIASNPMNQMWMQGPPPVFLNNEAPLLSRSLDALACAIRSCCDAANTRFEDMAKEMNASNASGGTDEEKGSTSHTYRTVMANESELCSRNMVLSAFALLQQHEAATASVNKHHGLHLLVTAMDAFLESGDEEETGGFTDSQIQSLLSVCNTTLQHPLLLFQGGPLYHMVSNAAILLCHLLNSLHANNSNKNEPGTMEAALFDEVLDTVISVRKLLNTHRRKLSVRLRCHDIPRPNFRRSAAHGGMEEASTTPFVDLGETVMCRCRGCQGFVLMACSPCVAAERAQMAANRVRMESKVGEDGNWFDHDNDEYNNNARMEFDLEDDALLNVLSRIIAT